MISPPFEIASVVDEDETDGQTLRTEVKRTVEGPQGDGVARSDGFSYYYEFDTDTAPTVVVTLTAIFDSSLYVDYYESLRLTQLDHLIAQSNARNLQDSSPAFLHG